jgi:hypothetical protein
VETRTLLPRIARRTLLLAIPLLCSMVWLILAGRTSEVVYRGTPVLSAPDSLGSRWSPVLRIPAGRYRARLVVERFAPLEAGETVARTWVGFVPEAITWHPNALGLRRFDLARERRRTYELTFEARSGERRQCVWRGDPRRTGLRLVHAELWRERRLLERPAGAVESRGLVLALLFLVGILVIAGWIGKSPSPPAGRWWVLWGFLGYALAGLGIWSLHSLVARLPANPGDSELLLLFPGLNPMPGPLVLVIFALCGSGIFLAWTLGRWPTLSWAVPIATLGLSFAAGLVGPRSDFQTYYTAGLALWGHSNPYAADPGQVLNPPPFILVCGLLPILSLTAAGFFWFGLKAAAALACVPLARAGLVGTGDSLEATGISWWRRPEWLGWIAAGRFLGMDLRYGNTNVLVVFLVLAAAASWVQGRQRSAALAVVTGVATKVTPVWNAIGAAAAGRWRWALGVIAAAGFAIAVSSAALEALAPGGGLGFFRHALPRAGDLQWGRVDNQSIRGMVDRFVGGAPVARVEGTPSLHQGARAARVTEALLDLLVLACVARLARRASRAGLASENGRSAWASLWAGTALAMVLTSPGSWRVHFAILYLPLVVLADRARRGERLAAVAFAGLAAIIVLPAFSRAISDWTAAYSVLTLASGATLAALAWIPGRDASFRDSPRSTPGTDAIMPEPVP